MSDPVYTHAMWRVAPGNEEAFIEAWEELGRAFSRLEHPPGTGILIRSTTDPSLFYSFGPWRSADHVAAMRADDEAGRALERLRSLCTEASPGMYRLVRQAEGGGVDVP